MAKKTQKNNILKKTIKNISKTTQVVVPKIESGLETLGAEVKKTAKKSSPMIKKGLSNMYGIVKTSAKYASKSFKKTFSKRKSRKNKSKRRH